MLKIKDDVDLKELEKFGFVYRKQINAYEYTGKKHKHYYIDDIADYYITENRELQINTYNGDYTLDDIIYDLIQAGLVEKIPEEK